MEQEVVEWGYHNDEEKQQQNPGNQGYCTQKRNSLEMKKTYPCKQKVTEFISTRSPIRNERGK
jgi:hypothetical protein